MTPRNARLPLREAVAIAILLIVLVASLVAHDWRGVLLGAAGSTYLIGRRWATIRRSRLFTWAQRLPGSWKVGLGFLLIILFQVPIVLLYDWRGGRIRVLLIGITVALAWLAWRIWRERRTGQNRAEG